MTDLSAPSTSSQQPVNSDTPPPGMIWWFAADPGLDVPWFWIPQGPGRTWADTPTVFQIEVAM